MSNRSYARSRALTLASAASATVLLAACGGDGGGDAVGDAGGSAVEGETTEITFAHSYPTEHPHHRCGAQLIADNINAQDIGLEIEVFPNSTLGADTDRFTTLQAGDIDMDIQGPSALAATHAPVGVLDVAYAVDGADHLFEFWDSETSADLRSGFEEETGAKILEPLFFGMRHFTANEPIRSPEDLEGLRMRFPDSPVYLENAKALGANATALSFEEIFLGLQQGIIDGQENPIPIIEANSYDEVQSHVSLSGHQTGGQLVIVNQETFDGLSEEQQEALQTAVTEARAENRTCIEEAEEEILTQWEESGDMEVVEDVDVDAFRERAEEYFRANLEGEQLAVYESLRESAPN